MTHNCGKTCPECGTILISNGACHSCPTCGYTDGCG